MTSASITHAVLITGSFGAGKTTTIRRLMETKPPDELWVVILNEFTDAGLDALAVAQVAQGRYDVRLVAGGCLCCAAEMEFGKQVRDILRHLKPARLLIEPSGAAHAGGIVDELARYALQGVLELDAVICLVDPIDAVRIAGAHDTTEWSPELRFSRATCLPRLEWLLEAYGSTLRRVKGVLRTGPGPAWTFQSHGRGIVCGDSGYRRDSRLEIVIAAAPTPEFVEGWRAMLRAAETSH